MNRILHGTKLDLKCSLDFLEWDNNLHQSNFLPFQEIVPLTLSLRLLYL